MLDTYKTGGTRRQTSQFGFYLLVFGLVRPPTRAYVPVGPLISQQPPERRMLAVLHTGPPDHGLVLGPCQRHVEVAQVLAAPFHFGGVEVHLVGQVAGVAAHVQLAPVPVRRVVENNRPAEMITRTCIPQIGAIDNRELEALGPVDRQHLYRGRVGIEPPAALLRFGAFGAPLVDPPGQPCPQRGEAKLGLARLGVEQFGDMAKIGELALSVHNAKQPLR